MTKKSVTPRDRKLFIRLDSSIEYLLKQRALENGLSLSDYIRSRLCIQDELKIDAKANKKERHFMIHFDAHNRDILKTLARNSKKSITMFVTDLLTQHVNEQESLISSGNLYSSRELYFQGETIRATNTIFWDETNLEKWVRVSTEQSIYNNLKKYALSRNVDLSTYVRYLIFQKAGLSFESKKFYEMVTIELLLKEANYRILRQRAEQQRTSLSNYIGKIITTHEGLPHNEDMSYARERKELVPISESGIKRIGVRLEIGNYGVIAKRAESYKKTVSDYVRSVLFTHEGLTSDVRVYRPKGCAVKNQSTPPENNPPNK